MRYKIPQFVPYLLRGLYRIQMDNYGLSINKKALNNRALRTLVDTNGLIFGRDGTARIN